MTRNVKLATAGLVLLTALGAQQGKLREIRPGFNLFSKDQDVQLGKESAAQVEKQMTVLKDPVLTEYINLLGTKIASQPQADKYPYTFKVLLEPSINAFALPGGPMFVHTGLITAADNEAQLVGVLAHEMSHVALRHGTNQASKANLIQLPAMLAGAVMGGSLLGQLGQVGVGLGANSVLLKFSRNAERDADLLGAQMMSQAGYNPIEMARFFEKLEAQGTAKIPQFLSDHPNPGNRVKAVEEEVQYMPQRDYNADSGQFQKMKERVARLKYPAKTQQAQAAGPQAAPQGAPADVRPTGKFKEYSGSDYMMRYPDTWETFGDKSGGAVTIAPRSAIVQTQGGGTAIGYGVMASVYFPPNGSATDLERETQDLIRQMQQSNAGMKTSGTGARSIRVDGQLALVTTLYSSSPYQGQREVDMLVTVSRPQGLFYIVFIAPESEFSQVQKSYEEMLKSVRFRG